MQQSMQLLSMSAQELDKYLSELAEENPLLEVTPPKESRERRLPAASSGYTRRSSAMSLEDGESLRPGFIYESLADDLREQIAGLRVPEVIRRQLRYLCAELDARGYLPEDAGDLAVFGNSPEMYENAVKVLQSLEPAGVGARSLQECLCIQLRRKGIKEELPYAVCREHLEKLARGQLNAIAKELRVSIGEVAEARSVIAALEPRPSNGYTDGKAVPYAVPDVEVSGEDGKLRALSADRYIPSCGVCDFYARMAESEGLTDEEREYFRAKLAQAKWAVSCVDRRRDTLVACAEAILERQRGFFEDGVSALSPMTMTELADTLGVHPSTVSRAVKGKYLSCKWGVYPMSHFFVRELNGPDSGTGRDVLAGIKELIAGEDAAKPLSDRELAERLTQRGLDVSRRTVAKYRDEAMIPSAPGRRER